MYLQTQLGTATLTRCLYPIGAVAPVLSIPSLKASPLRQVTLWRQGCQNTLQ